MPQKVLSVGQCGFDHASLARFLRKSFDVTVDTADTAQEALDQLRADPVDLVLVNRKLDADGSDGMAIVKAIQADAALSSIPVILVSNYADAQSAAVAAGALPGFGKSDIGSEEAIAKLAAVLKAKS